MKRLVLVLATLFVSTSVAVAEEGNSQVEGATVSDDVLLLVSGGQFTGDYGYTKAGTDAAERIYQDRLGKAEAAYAQAQDDHETQKISDRSFGAAIRSILTGEVSEQTSRPKATAREVAEAKERVDGWRDALSDVHSYKCDR
jgi:hypothetical protein